MDVSYFIIHNSEENSKLFLPEIHSVLIAVIRLVRTSESPLIVLLHVVNDQAIPRRKALMAGDHVHEAPGAAAQGRQSLVQHDLTSSTG